ncbi:unnamed protein product [Enterobius vermicularis]|uniref:C3H1-type domain-containing protein n=1 Tax=Enterobius vermicularis TaxID=51028 RepID=A0A0N4VGG4_ENTVE|nr:unnamed protein product [Enterobius vermicularis]
MTDISSHTLSKNLDGSAESFSIVEQRQNMQFSSSGQDEKALKKETNDLEERYGYFVDLDERDYGNSKIFYSLRRYTGHQGFSAASGHLYNGSLNRETQNVHGVAGTSNENFININLAKPTVEGVKNSSSSEISKSITNIQHSISRLHVRASSKDQSLNCSAESSFPKKHHRKHRRSYISSCLLSGRVYLPLQYAKHTLETVYEGPVEDLEEQEETKEDTAEDKICEMYLWCGYCVLGDDCPYADSHEGGESEDWPMPISSY